jgi:hypothetical protein
MGCHHNRDVGVRRGQRGEMVGVEGAIELGGPTLASRRVDVDDRHHLSRRQRQSGSVEIEHQAARANQHVAQRPIGERRAGHGAHRAILSDSTK